jgi:hypothetical protein
MDILIIVPANIIAHPGFVLEVARLDPIHIPKEPMAAMEKQVVAVVLALAVVAVV